MAKRPNFYHLLDLEPDVDDWSTIEERLQAKLKEWSRHRTTGNPKQRREAARNLSLLKEIEATLKEPSGRKQEAAAERTRRKRLEQESFRELDRIIEVLLDSGRCDQDAFKKVVKDFQATLSEAQIRKRFIAAGVQIGAKEEEKKERKQVEKIDGATARTLRRNLDLLNLTSLYEFLDRKPQSSPQALQDRAREILNENHRLGRKTPDASAQNELAGFAQKVFASDEEKAKYDAYRATEVLEGLKSSIEMAGMDRILSREELDTLIRQARELGASAEQARDYLEEYAENRGWVIYQDREAPIQNLRCCGFCLTLATDAEARRCGECGELLGMECPQCGETNPTDRSACGECGCRIGDAPLVRGLVAEGERLFLGGDLQEALQSFQKALHYWPTWQPALAGLEQVEQESQNREKVVRSIEAAIRDRRFLTAQAELERYQRDRASHGLAALRQRIDEGVRRAEQAFQSGEEARRRGDLEAALERYEQALGACIDFTPAQRAMASSPPPSPTALEIQPLGEGFRLVWKPPQSRGNLGYRVLRKVGGTSRDPEDGDCLGTISDTLLDDPDCPIGVAVHYAIYTDRAGVYSRASAHQGPVLRLGEVSRAEAVAGEGVVDLHWENPAGCRRVEVWREKGSRSPQRGQGERVPVTDTSAHDTGLVDGTRYSYRIVALFPDPQDPRRELHSPGVTLSAVPVAPPAPVRDLTSERDGSRLTLTWTPPPGATVEIRQSQTLLAGKPGMVVPESQRARWGSVVSGSGQGIAQVDIASQGKLYFVPFTVRQGTAVLGTPCTVVTLDPCTHLKVQRSGRTLVLTWDWPPGVDNVLVRYARDRAPQNPTGGDAPAIRVTRREYERAGGWHLRRAEQVQYCFTVFPQAPEGDLYGPGVSTVLTLGSVPAIRYHLVQKRHWLRRRTEDAWLELASDSAGQHTLPTLLMVAKARGVPISPQDGRRLARIDNLSLEDGRGRIPIPKPEWDSGAFVKLFFEDPADAQQLRLLPAAQEDLCLD